MADPKHVKIVKQGKDAIQAWRKMHSRRRLDLSGVDLSLADLREANLSWANLSEANLSSADLSWANLARADLVGADLDEANLIGANLAGADFTAAGLVGANLTDARIAGANLKWTDLSGADLSGAICCFTEFPDLDLSNVKGLDRAIHEGPSMVGVDTLFLSKGRIPEIFLRGCGVPERLIELLPSLVGAAIEFYTCFISYTEADDAFSERLYNDLRGAGVRCWRWKEDAPWGKTLMRSIDEAVRIYDKLIVVCSQNSLNKAPVLREIERALQKEDELFNKGKEAEVLFPIRLDDYIFDKWEHERKADVIKKHVGDFRQWNDPQSYKKALDRLIRDLRAEKSPENEA